MFLPPRNKVSVDDSPFSAMRGSDALFPNDFGGGDLSYCCAVCPHLQSFLSGTEVI